MVYYDPYLHESQVLVVFADHLQLVVEAVGHDHVPGIVHHQRVGATELQIPFAILSETTGVPVILDHIDAVQTFICGAKYVKWKSIKLFLQTNNIDDPVFESDELAARLGR